MLTGYEAADKLKIVKELKNVLNLGLKESKDLAEKLPAKLASGVSRKDAEALAEKLKPSNAKIEIV